MSSVEQTHEGGHTGQGSTAAERLGGPTESELKAEKAEHASGEHASGEHASGDAGRHSSNGHGEQRATLIPKDRAEGYNRRWNEIKGEFVDDPRHAVRGANAMVGEVLDELEELFRKQRDEIENGLDGDKTSTEDLRQALGRYRSFFDRLLSF
jgi:hypothetical protein